MKFSFLCWNLRQYKGSRKRLEDARELIADLNPDIFGLIEFMAERRARELMLEFFPEYDFAITESRKNFEIIVGWRRNKFKQVIWTQKREFQNKNLDLRPGGLLSVNYKGEFHNLLFLHTHSGENARAYKNRKAMYRKIWKLRSALEAVSPNGRANFIALGDLNTMGKSKSISAEREIRDLARDAEKHHMQLLSKNEELTWH